jgi:predicted nucleic acid-binding protein
MSGLYIDTSVLVAYYTPEVHSVQAEAAILGATDRVVSPLCLSEANAALRAKTFHGSISLLDAIIARDRFRAHYSAGFYRMTPVEERHFEQAADIVWQLGLKLRTMDALHLVAAQAAGLHLATADERLRDAARAANVVVAWAGA